MSEKAEVVYLSGDGGSTWQPFADGLSPEATVSCFISNGTKIFASTEFHGIFLNEGGAGKWQSVSGNLPKDVHIKAVEIVDNILIIGTSGHGILTSPDEGKTWRYIYRPHTVHDISNDGKYIYAMTLGDGLLKTGNDGVTWEQAGNFKFYTFEVKNSGTDLFAAQWTGIYHSRDAGAIWTLIEGGLPDSTAFCTLENTAYGLIAGIGLRQVTLLNEARPCHETTPTPADFCLPLFSEGAGARDLVPIRFFTR